MPGLTDALNGWARVLKTPRARRMTAGGLVGRMREGGTGLALIFALRHGDASFAVAGLGSAAYLAGASVARPAHGRWLDRKGTRRPLLGASAVNAALLVAVAVASRRHAGAWLLVALSVGVGLSLPALSAAMRAQWPMLAPHDADRAYALDTLSYELTLIAAPALVGLVAVAASPAVALLTIAALGLIGTFVVVTAIPPMAAVAAAAAEPAGAEERHHALNPAVRMLVAVSLLVGAAEGSMIVLAPAIAAVHHDHSASGLLISAFSLGSLIGVLAYGAIEARGRLVDRLLAGCIGLTAAFAVLALVGGSLAGFAGGAALAGLALSPTLTIGFAAIRRAAAPRALTEAFTWASFAAAAGAAGSQALIGVLVSGAGTATALWVPAALAGGATAAAGVARVAGSDREGAGGSVPRDRG